MADHAGIQEQETHVRQQGKSWTVVTDSADDASTWKFYWAQPAVTFTDGQPRAGALTFNR